MKKSAFTLIELLIVIVIVGILATMGIASYNKYQESARDAIAQTEMSQMIRSIEMARIIAQVPLPEISSLNCPRCIESCYNNDLRHVPATNICVVNWIKFLTELSATSGVDLRSFERDPWGSPYLVDTNDQSFPVGHEFYCAQDNIISAGPNGVRHAYQSSAWSGSNPNNYTSTDSEDDYQLKVSYFVAKPDCN